jgi:hypothetical protein
MHLAKTNLFYPRKYVLQDMRGFLTTCREAVLEIKAHNSFCLPLIDAVIMA